MTVSYAESTTTGGVNLGGGTLFATKVVPRQDEVELWDIRKAQLEQRPQKYDTIVHQPNPHKEEVMSSGTKLVRYHVVDADPVLAEKLPEAGVVMSGTTMLNGMDEKGFVMDLAPRVAEKLEAHNASRWSVEYDDDEGNTKRLKPIRLGQLDVVLEILKAY